MSKLGRSLPLIFRGSEQSESHFGFLGGPEDLTWCTSQRTWTSYSTGGEKGKGQRGSGGDGGSGSTKTSDALVDRDSRGSSLVQCPRKENLVPPRRILFPEASSVLRRMVFDSGEWT